MLVVTLMLLIGTTIAAMTVYALSVEIRSAGYYRQQAQTHYVAEAALQGVLSLHPRPVVALLRNFENTPIVAASPVVTNVASILNYDEPDPALVPGGGKRVFRMYKSQLDARLVGDPAGGGQPVQQGLGQSLGSQVFAPWYVIDFMDYTVTQQAVPGQDASGNATETWVKSTLAIRGRTMLDDGTGQPVAVVGSRGASSTVGGARLQEFTDGAYDMRIVVRIGPVNN